MEEIDTPFYRQPQEESKDLIQIDDLEDMKIVLVPISFATKIKTRMYNIFICVIHFIVINVAG